jgi:hypothetical protein
MSMDYSVFKYIKLSEKPYSPRQRNIEVSYELDDISYAHELRTLMHSGVDNSGRFIDTDLFAEPKTIQLSPYLTLHNVRLIIAFEASSQQFHYRATHYIDGYSPVLVKLAATVYEPCFE